MDCRWLERYLIDDIGIKADIKKVLAEKYRMTVLDAGAMTNALLAWQRWKQLEPRSTLIVLPGNGASIVKKYIDNAKPHWFGQWPNIAFPDASRVWIPGKCYPQAFVERIALEQMLLGISNVVIIDDVISSASTINCLRRINMPWIPGARWQAAAWVMQDSASTRKFSQAFAAEAVGTYARKAPINSLSTLIKHPSIVNNYAERNLGREAGSFLEVIDSLR